MTKIEPIIFRQGENGKTEVCGNFPERICVATDLLREASNRFLQINDDGVLVVNVSNGWANYVLDQNQESDFGITFRRIAFGSI